MSHPSAQSPCQIENFVNASKKPLKNKLNPSRSAPRHTNTTASPKYATTSRSHRSTPVRIKYNSLGELENTPSKLTEAFYEAGSPMEEKKYDKEKLSKKISFCYFVFISLVYSFAFRKHQIGPWVGIANLRCMDCSSKMERKCVDKE